MSYPGGKGNIYQRLINLIPPHRVYVETHLGGGTIARTKRPADVNYLIDIDEDVIANSGDIATSTDTGVDWRFEACDVTPWLRAYAWTGDEFVYADPPYLFSTRRAHRHIYRYEYTTEDHIALLSCLTSLPCAVMVSGYWSELYADMLSDWSTVTIDTITRGGTPATEWVWMNYPTPTKLHDYRYLGDDFRERERIKRKIDRWVNRLQSLPALERRAILSAIAKSSDNLEAIA